MKLPELAEKIARTFNLSDLRGLCFDLGVDYEDLSGQNKKDKIIALVNYCKNRHELEELVNQCKILRLKETWHFDESWYLAETIPPQQPHDSNSQPNLRFWIAGTIVFVLFIFGLVNFPPSFFATGNTTPTEIVLTPTRSPTETVTSIPTKESTDILTSIPEQTIIETVPPTKIPATDNSSTLSIEQILIGNTKGDALQEYKHLEVTLNNNLDRDVLITNVSLYLSTNVSGSLCATPGVEVFVISDTLTIIGQESDGIAFQTFVNSEPSPQVQFPVQGFIYNGKCAYPVEGEEGKINIIVLQFDTATILPADSLSSITVDIPISFRWHKDSLEPAFLFGVDMVEHYISEIIFTPDEFFCIRISTNFTEEPIIGEKGNSVQDSSSCPFLTYSK